MTNEMLLPYFLNKSLSYGSSVEVEGELMASPAKGQRLELQATDINLLGPCDNEVYTVV